MRKISYLIVYVLFLICIDVKAISECTSEEMKKLRELSKSFDIKYEYNIIEEKDEDGTYKYPIYKIKILNMDNSLKISYTENRSGLISVSQSELESREFYEGANLTFSIYSKTDSLCTDVLLKKINIILPFYNNYYFENKEKCEKYSGFSYCQEFVDDNKENEEIDKLFEKYIKEQNGNKQSGENKNIFNSYIYLIILLILVISIILFVIIKNKKKKVDDL